MSIVNRSLGVLKEIQEQLYKPKSQSSSFGTQQQSLNEEETELMRSNVRIFFKSCLTLNLN